MIERSTPKYKTGFMVRDRELGRDYTIKSFNYHQQNGDIWYSAVEDLTQDKVVICESWLTLVKRPRFEDSR